MSRPRPQAAALLSAGVLSPDKTRRPDHFVEGVIALVDELGIVELGQSWKQAERERLGRHPGGRKHVDVDDRAMCVAMWIAALANEPMHITTWVKILFLQISDRKRAELGVPDPPDPGDTEAWERLDRNMRYRFHSFIEAMDPSLLPKNRNLTPQEFDAEVERITAEKQLTEDVIAERYDRLTEAANNILEVTFKRIPREIRRRWSGDVGVDATAIPSFSRGDVKERRRRGEKKRRLKYKATDPDAYWYSRRDENGNETNEAVETASGKKLKSGFWAYEASLVVTGSADERDGRSFPKIVGGMAPLHKPSSEPGLNGALALQDMDDRGHPAGLTGADRAYTHAAYDKYQEPTREIGRTHVLDYRDDQLGRKDGWGGAPFIESRFYCPMIPDVLANATIDYRNDKITEEVWRERLEARRPYELRPKEAEDDAGSIRFGCPAGSPAPQATCDRKPDSKKNVRGKKKIRIPVTSEPAGGLPKVCRQRSITIPRHAAGKLRQGLRFHSDEWESSYALLRNTIEGFNGLAKDGAYEALADSTKRRVAGVAAQTILVAMLIAAANLRKIATFLTTARADPDGVERTPKKRRQKTTQALAQSHSASLKNAGPAP